MFIPPRRIALSGGGMRGLAHIGALEVLEERGYLKAVKEYIGISAGAFCAFAICIGCTLTELRMVTALLDFGLMRSLQPEDMFRFTETFGLDSGANMEKLLAALARTKGLSATITFRELAAKLPDAPALRVFATDLNTCMPKEFSLAATPDAGVCHALRASMAIPIYFTPVTDTTGHTLVDGGIVTHFPFQILSDAERDVTLGIAFSDAHKDISGARIGNLFRYMGQLYHSIYYHHMRTLDVRWKDHIVYLPCGAFSSVHFEATAEEKLDLMNMGRRGMEEFLARGNRRRPPRRFSAV
jgi:NTE family protein